MHVREEFLLSKDSSSQADSGRGLVSPLSTSSHSALAPPSIRFWLQNRTRFLQGTSVLIGDSMHYDGSREDGMMADLRKLAGIFQLMSGHTRLVSNVVSRAV